MILLDSKCYPLLENDDTSDPEYWKSTRKIIAAAKEVYIKLGGVPTDADLSRQMHKTGGTCGDTEPPAKMLKMAKGLPNDGQGISDKLDVVIRRLDAIDKRTRLLEELRRGFECCICKHTSRKPLVSPCCGRLIGCRTCVDFWVVNGKNCPLCRMTREIDRRFELKGFDDVTSLFRAMESDEPYQFLDTANEIDLSQLENQDDDDDDVFEQRPI